MRLATLDIEGRSQAAVETSRGFVGLPFSNVGDLLRVPRWREIAEQQEVDAEDRRQRQLGIRYRRRMSKMGCTKYCQSL